jgi:hypothetical protein
MKRTLIRRVSESGNEKDDLSLFNLVRGGSKKRVNFLCTSVEGGEYVPTRCASLMINAREGKDEFKPRRGRSENRKGNDEPDDDKGKTHLRFATPKKKRTPPSSSSSDDEASDKPKMKKGRSRKSNKQALVEWDKGQQDISGRTLESRRKDVPSSSSALDAGPPKEKYAWGSSDAEGFRLTWSVMKGYDDLLDDRRADAEWTVKCDEQKRIVHDKNLGSGRSPPPK